MSERDGDRSGGSVRDAGREVGKTGGEQGELAVPTAATLARDLRFAGRLLMGVYNSRFLPSNISSGRTPVARPPTYRPPVRWRTRV
jgi:hypothetical protein